jgi:hypothetical protein
MSLARVFLNGGNILSISLSMAGKKLSPFSPSVSRHPTVKLTSEVAAAMRLGDD